MNLVFSDQPMPINLTKSIFLAGPSPRDLETIDWRVKAIEHLKSVNFQGTVFIPIPEQKFYGSSDSDSWNYNDQVNWECEARDIADIILFWVPRSISGKMPGFVTNIEFGEDLATSKVVYGRPPEAEKCKYLDKRFQDLGFPVHETLENTLSHAIRILGDGEFRENGEIYVPLFVWKSKQFQSWYKNLKASGNTLCSAKVFYNFKLPNEQLFSFIMKVKIWLNNESRFKENEFIFSRTDTVQSVLYYKDLNGIKIVLVKEFRSPVNNDEGYVYELPGGSSLDFTKNDIDILKSEIEEETGLEIKDQSRFIFISKKQSLATVSTHQSSLYKVELTDIEYSELLKNIGKNYGCKEEGENTFIEIVDLKDITRYPLDYSMIGMIYNALMVYE